MYYSLLFGAHPQQALTFISTHLLHVISKTMSSDKSVIIVFLSTFSVVLAVLIAKTPNIENN
jgi:hypothetical protein